MGGDDAAIGIEPLDLRMLIKNLVDKAICNTSPGGRVDVLVAPGEQAVDLIVDDTGPGIRETERERERVYDPFYRMLDNGGQGGSPLCQYSLRHLPD